MRILFCGTGWLPLVEQLRARLPAGSTVDVRDPARPLREQVGGYQVLLPSNGRVDEEVFAAADALRLVQQPAAGYDGVELEPARRRGIPVCYAPGRNAEALAEAALLLLLSLARRVPEARRALREGKVGEPVGVELCGKTLGIVGLGRSGEHLSRIAEAMGMRVLWVRSGSAPDAWDALLRGSDFVSLHCPLTERTRGLFDADAFARMKPGAFLVSCARAPVVDRAALLAALDRGHLAGVGVDVHWVEPPPPDDPFYGRDDVVALPHVGGSTRESFERLVDVVVDNVARVERGEEPRHRVA